MKVAFAKPDDTSGRELLKQGMQSEKDNALEQAIAIYNRMIKMHYRREFAYRRLMILYRKQKNYKKELDTINEAIGEFTKILFQSPRMHEKKIETLSRKLSLLTGLSGKTGKASHQPEPIASWERRKKRLNKLLKIK